MKIRVTTIAVVALLAISAPAAFARIAPDPVGTQLTIKHAAALHVVKHKVAKQKAKASTSRSGTGRRLIIVAPIQSPSSSIPGDSASYCSMYMTDCTPEQLCAIWGANCGDVQSQAPATDSQPAPDPVAPAAPAVTDTSSSTSQGDASRSGQSGDVSASLAASSATTTDDGYDEDC